MRTKLETDSDEAEKRVREIRRATQRQYSAEEKIRIVIAGLRGEDSIAELCRKEGINQNLYYRWSKNFLEAGKKRLARDTAREATGDEVKEIQAQARQLKELVAELRIENRLPKKAYSSTSWAQVRFSDNDDCSRRRLPSSGAPAPRAR
jgi:transposase